jgi:acylphosphatase
MPLVNVMLSLTPAKTRKYHTILGWTQKGQFAIRRDLIKSRACRPQDVPTVHEETIARCYYISGMVQGVGYRYFAQRAARKLQLTGYVRNLRDGRVEVYAVGIAASMIALRKELERGPYGASVSSVTEEEAAHESKLTQAFSIEYES